MTFRFDTRHLNSQQQAIVRQRERDHQIERRRAKEMRKRNRRIGEKIKRIERWR